MRLETIFDDQLKRTERFTTSLNEGCFYDIATAVVVVTIQLFLFDKQEQGLENFVSEKISSYEF